MHSRTGSSSSAGAGAPIAPPSPVELADGSPYPHQVGGHGLLTRTRAGFLLKPSCDKEHSFYNYIHSPRLPHDLRWLRDVTPKYYGHYSMPPPLPPGAAVDAPPEDAQAARQNGDEGSAPARQGDMPAQGSPLLKKQKHPAPPRPPKTSSHIPSPVPEHLIMLADPADPDPHRGCDFLASPDIPHPSRSLRPPPFPHADAVRWRFNDDPETMAADVSPWATRMDKKKKKPQKRPRPCIKLEDVNLPFMLPCVLDCKMGVRHFDDDASDEKRRRHMHKARTTTSAKCGIRYTGMQSFKSGDRCGVYDVKDKYHGRTLAEKDLIPMATWFFHNDHDLRGDAIHLLLDKLKNLRPYVRAQQHFYFYSSSLLLVYEGASPDLAPPRVEVRMIDFAHTVLSNGKSDDGYSQGLDYLIDLFVTILHNDKTGRTVMAPSLSMLPEQKKAMQAKIARKAAAAAAAGENGNVIEASGKTENGHGEGDERKANGVANHAQVS